MLNAKIKQSGSALVYILVAIALMAALISSFASSDSQQTRSRNAFKLANKIQDQIDIIKAAIDECVVLYPEGDGIANPATVYPQYPINPNASYFDGSAMDGFTARYAKDIACPGNPGETKDHTPIFGVNTGKSLQAAPTGLDDWLYFNGKGVTFGAQTHTGVYIYINAPAASSDAFIDDAFTKVKSQYGNCEVDILTSADPICTNKCLRYWIIRESPACP
ncbi:MAG: hypothetical protein CMH30_05480 [Micavibrio sp.]|nr:hypothetical protein [Micavibrio sp.]|tara:strand:+ start:2482 stop:3141 length:660 start_codon:yes stop_codon:yes gene_type:complete